MDQPNETPNNNEPSSNFDKWCAYCNNLVSPWSFVEAGALFIATATLQRRVWLPPTNAPLYPNIYVIPTGDAGVGKGMIIKEVAKVLRYHKMENPNIKNVNGVNGANKLDKENQAIVDNASEVNFERAEAEENNFGLPVGGGKKKERLSLEKPLCIPMAADDSTYEALVKALSKSLRYKDYPKFNPKTEKFEAGIYAHSSLAFNLEEISSIFKKNKDNVAKLFLNTYDCGDYTYDTKTQGKDKIKNCCLNFMGGTTPTFLEEVFGSQLLTDGFASRTWFIFENESRDNGFFFKDWEKNQMIWWQDIVNHVGKLLNLYGEIKYGEGVREYLEEWWKENKFKRANDSSKLDSYYSRKKAHILKCAVARHFLESTEMVLPLWAVKWAIEWLYKIEKKMHLALGFGDTNPLTRASRKVISHLKKEGRQNYNAILIEVYPYLPKGKSDFDEVLEFLLMSKQIEKEEESNKLGQVVNFYKINEATKIIVQ